MSISAGILSLWSTTSSVWTVILALTAVWLYYRIKNRRFIELGNKLPGPFALPLIGNAYLAVFARSQMDVFHLFRRTIYSYEKTSKCGMGRAWLGPRLLIGIWNPEGAEAILSSNVHLTKPVEYDFFRPWFGNGLLISSGDKWRTHRKLIAPTFHLSVLKTFIPLFNENSRATVKRMEKEIGKEFDAHDYMVETTVEILLETAMGVNRKTHANAYDYGIAVMKMCDIISNRHIKCWLRSDFIFNLTKLSKMQEKFLNTIHSLTRKVVAEKLLEKRVGKKNVNSFSDQVSFQDDYVSSENEPLSFGQNVKIKDDIDDDTGEKKRIPFLEQLVDMSEDGAILTEAEIKEQVDTIMFEGHDTTAAAASFFICVMGYHTEYQEKCVEELQEIFGDSDRPASFQDTLEMKYLERCILETLRYFPPVPVIARDLSEDCNLGMGKVAPKGTTIGILTFILHHLEDYYPNPDVFNPDNFLPDKVTSRHPYSFIPFSSGPRSCVGRKYAMLKLKILLSTILRNYRLVSDIPPAKYRLQADIILKRADGFKVKIEPRNIKKEKCS